MRLVFCFGLAFLAANPVWSQLSVIPYETSTPAVDDRMETPPPVSGQAYPTMVGAETRSNYLAAGLIFSTAYADNVIAGGNGVPINDVLYSILPRLELDKNTPRQQLALKYSPGFTLYQRTSVLDAANQTATLNFQYRLSEHSTMSVIDYFQKSSNAFNTLYTSSAHGTSNAQSLSPEVVAPYANRLQNTGNVELSHQFSRDGMIGASGLVTESSYSDSAAASDLYNSFTRGGSAFFSQRLPSGTQYLGLKYQYTRSQVDPVNPAADSVSTETNVQTHTLLAFFTVYFSPTISLSLSGGPQYFDAAQYSSLPYRSWTPSATLSIGWQKSRTNFVAGYSRTVSGDTGLPGVFESDSANTSARWKITRVWTVGLSANYFINKNVTPLFGSSSAGGHTISGSFSMERQLSEHVKAEFVYVRLHQSYSGIAVITAAPDCSSAVVSISYELSRPLGR